MARSLLLLILLLATPVFASEVDTDLNVTIIGQERLTAGNWTALRHLLTQVPRGFYKHLRFITVDEPETIGETTKARCPDDIPCAINIFSGNEGAVSGEWPADLPGPVPDASAFYYVAAHELAHQVALAVPERGLQPWATQLIQEAGCEPSHYLRSQFLPCFFADDADELVASMAGNAWMVCSECVLRLAVHRVQQGNPHPMNQALFLMRLFGSTAGEHPTPYGQITAYRMQDGLPVAEVWTIWPNVAACKGNVNVAAPSFSMGLRLKQRGAVCAVIAVTHREGI